MNNINIFGEKLNNFKNNNMKEIINLRNLVESNNNNTMNIKDQFYLKIIDIIKYFFNMMPNNTINIGKFPTFSLNDENNIKYQNIINVIKILTDYIISNNKNNNNKINEELSKRSKEMSELLIKSNENLSKLRKDNIDLKQNYNNLELKYNLLMEQNKKVNLNNNEIKNLKNELNKKNQQIKSLEHMVTRLTNKIDNNKENNIDNNNKDNSINDNNEYNLYFKGNKFVKNEKNEKYLRKFLDKFTNGEYSNLISEDNNLINLKEQIEKVSQKINKSLENIK